MLEINDGFLQSSLPGGGVLEKEIKSDGQNGVAVARDNERGDRHIYRTFVGSCEVYKKLMEADCPNLPTIEAAEEKNGRAYVLEEYIPGDTLDYVLDGGPLTEDQTRSIAVQICRALETIHSLGAVHRDVKPDNILLHGDEAVLIDFDVSRLLKPERDTDTQVMGTTGYAAPEQYGLAQTDARSDIYALGVVINEMLTGKHPSTSLTEGSLRTIVEKCIEVNADKRFSSAAELRKALEKKPCRKQRRIILVAVMLAVVCAAAVALFLWGRGKPIVTEDEDTLQKGYSTGFSFDLDGDGIPEDYVFGVGADLPGRKPGTMDSMPLFDGNVECRTLAPCVWSWTEENGFERMDEFAELLQEPKVTIVCVEKTGTELPHMEKTDPLDGVWNGAIRIDYSYETTGIWRCEGMAVLDGETLTAALVTVITQGVEEAE